MRTERPGRRDALRVSTATRLVTGGEARPRSSANQRRFPGARPRSREKTGMNRDACAEALGHVSLGSAADPETEVLTPASAGGALAGRLFRQGQGQKAPPTAWESFPAP